MPIKKKNVVPPRKSTRLASKGTTSKRPVVVGLDDDSSSHTTPETQPDVPHSSLKPATPPVTHIPSPPPSSIPFAPSPITETPISPHPHTSPSLGFTAFSNPSTVPVTALDLILNKLKDLQFQFYSFQDEVRVS